MAVKLDELPPLAWDAFVEKRQELRGRSPVEDYLWDAKTRLFEIMASGESCDIRLIRGPVDANTIDGVCSTIGSSYENLLEMRAMGRTAALAVPILAMKREQYQSAAETWMAARGIAVNGFLFSDDVVEIVETARAVGSDTVLIEEVPMATSPVKCPDVVAGSCGCHSSYVASQLLGRASSLGPAARPAPRRPGQEGRGGLFATGPATEDALFTEMLALLREVVVTMSCNFSKHLEDVTWCTADADVAQAVTAMFQFAK
jgi:hypothetical protein